eukprot:SAG22_NODE_11832_length_467_cov_1.019022_2_plen_28_part_01
MAEEWFREHKRQMDRANAPMHFWVEEFM